MWTINKINIKKMNIKKMKKIPKIEKGISICKMPDLKELNGDNPEGQHIVDHGIIRANNGKWQLWACLRGVKVGRLLYGWEGNSLETENWKHSGIKMRANPDFGESIKENNEEQIGAPFFIKENNEYFCFYHSNGIRVAKSTDGINYDKLRPNTTSIPSGRDVMIMKHERRFYSYVTNTIKDSNDELISYVYTATSADLVNWSKTKIVSQGGKGGSGPVDAESPFVVFIDGYFYLFRTSSMTFKSVVYRSKDPQDFGINDDSKLVCELDEKILELFEYENQWYTTHISEDFQSVLLSKINWK